MTKNIGTAIFYSGRVAYDFYLDTGQSPFREDFDTIAPLYTQLYELVQTHADAEVIERAAIDTAYAIGRINPQKVDGHDRLIVSTHIESMLQDVVDHAFPAQAFLKRGKREITNLFEEIIFH